MLFESLFSTSKVGVSYYMISKFVLPSKNRDKKYRWGDKMGVKIPIRPGNRTQIIDIWALFVQISVKF